VSERRVKASDSEREWGRAAPSQERSEREVKAGGTESRAQ
jgi:hypothetical protein